MKSSFAEPASQNVFDSVNFHRDVARRQPGKIADRACVHSFEIGNDDLPVEWFQALD
ncbi:MAG: hypothetical protein H7039_21830 [Bryobacteraceae bacterium]|nr:hypothetical protein [Bryobacteraceae bacterium]